MDLISARREGKLTKTRRERFPASVSLLVFISLAKSAMQMRGSGKQCSVYSNEIKWGWRIEGFERRTGKDRFSKVYLADLLRIVSWVVRRCGVLARAVGRLIVRWSITILIVVRTILIAVMVVASNQQCWDYLKPQKFIVSVEMLLIHLGTWLKEPYYRLASACKSSEQ